MKFQKSVDRWLLACFGIEIARNKAERNHRFLEESLELVQSTGCTKEEALQLVDYVYGRDVGETTQEVGGVMNTLAALCIAHDIDMIEAGEIEIERCWTKVEKIRAKQAAKPQFSPLPQ
jgi:NTP pyrophosphatase (non-canonical NTP hydrolase)